MVQARLIYRQKRKGWGLRRMRQIPVVLQYEGHSKSSVMNGSPCAGRGFASLILCIHICHHIRNPLVKFQRNHANINIVIDIQSSISHLHWTLFEDKKEERDEIGGANFHKNSCCVETFAPKRDVEQSYQYNNT